MIIIFCVIIINFASEYNHIRYMLDIECKSRTLLTHKFPFRIIRFYNALGAREGKVHEFLITVQFSHHARNNQFELEMAAVIKLQFLCFICRWKFIHWRVNKPDAVSLFRVFCHVRESCTKLERESIIGSVNLNEFADFYWGTRMQISDIVRGWFC